MVSIEIHGFLFVDCIRRNALRFRIPTNFPVFAMF
jgi:hypothetical protein